MAALTLQEELERSVRAIVAAVGGDDALMELAYTSLLGEQHERHEFYVVVRARAKGAVVGKNGANAHHIRELVRTRAHLLGSPDAVDVRFIGSRAGAPLGLEFRA